MSEADDTAASAAAPKAYAGIRTLSGTIVTVRTVPDNIAAVRLLDIRRDLHDHAGSFNWGEPALGAAQLALAILADYLADGDGALHLHAQFATDVVTHFPHDGWALSDRAIARWLRRLEDHRFTGPRG